MRGKVAEFCRNKGHGFIIPSDGDENLFFHISELVCIFDQILFNFLFEH